ncbi:MAG: hypothetical protein U1G07_17790 [Verrucomicrobiota bacterium]
MIESYSQLLRDPCRTPVKVLRFHLAHTLVGWVAAVSLSFTPEPVFEPPGSRSFNAQPVCKSLFAHARIQAE